MMQATQHRITHYPMVTSSYSVDIRFRWNWYLLVKPLMKAGLIKIGHIFLNETIQMSLVKDHHVIQTFSLNTADEPLTYRIRFGRSHRCSDNLDAPPLRDLCETLSILAVVVSNEKTRSFSVGCCFSYSLGNPALHPGQDRAGQGTQIPQSTGLGLNRAGG